MSQKLCSDSFVRNLAILFLISAVLIAGCTAPAESGENVTGSAEGGFSEVPDQEGGDEGDIDDAESQELENQTDTDTEAEVEVVSENDSDTSEGENTSVEGSNNVTNITRIYVNGSWPLPRYDSALTGHTTESDGPESEPENKWVYNAGETLGGSPVVKDGVVVFSSGSMLIGLNASNREVLWEFTADKTLSQPIIDGSTVYVATKRQEGSLSNRATGKLYGLQLENGNELLERDIKTGLINTPLPIKGSVFLPQEDGIISRTGPGQSLLEVEELGSPSIMLAGERGTLFASTGLGEIYRFSIETGGLETIWKEEKGSSITRPPVLDSNSVYVTPMKVSGIDLENTSLSEFSGNSSEARNIELRSSLESLDKETGQRNWVKKFEAPIVSSPTVYEDSVTAIVSYPSTRRSTLKTYDRDSGKLLWERDLRGLYLDVTSSKNRLYLNSAGGRIKALSYSGEDLWTRNIGRTTVLSPAITGKYLFVGEQSGEVYAVGE